MDLGLRAKDRQTGYGSQKALGSELTHCWFWYLDDFVDLYSNSIDASF